MALTLEEATTMLNGAIAKAKELDIYINCAVVDAGGRMLTFARMDGAIWAGRYGSEGKAVAAASFGLPSGSLGGMNLAFFEKFSTEAGLNAQGAVPIVKDGNLVGAIGVGGGTGQEDEDCARAGLSKLPGATTEYKGNPFKHAPKKSKM